MAGQRLLPGQGTRWIRPERVAFPRWLQVICAAGWQCAHQGRAAACGPPGLTWARALPVALQAQHAAGRGGGPHIQLGQRGGQHQGAAAARLAPRGQGRGPALPRHGAPAAVRCAPGARRHRRERPRPAGMDGGQLGGHTRGCVAVRTCPGAGSRAAGAWGPRPVPPRLPRRC